MPTRFWQDFLLPLSKERLWRQRTLRGILKEFSGWGIAWRMPANLLSTLPRRSPDLPPKSQWNPEMTLIFVRSKDKHTIHNLAKWNVMFSFQRQCLGQTLFWNRSQSRISSFFRRSLFVLIDSAVPEVLGNSRSLGTSSVVHFWA